ncbi:hypothetical protein EfmJHP36_22630 [Enterococcus faecium]|nr:hypothetical protein EfmJHP36_22630 [Enterococcus faecium]
MTKIISQIFVKFRLISEEATSEHRLKRGCDVVTTSFDDYDTKNIIYEQNVNNGRS